MSPYKLKASLKIAQTNKYVTSTRRVFESDLTLFLTTLFSYACPTLREGDTLPVSYTGTWKIQRRNELRRRQIALVHFSIESGKRQTLCWCLWNENLKECLKIQGGAKEGKSLTDFTELSRLAREVTR